MSEIAYADVIRLEREHVLRVVARASSGKSRAKYEQHRPEQTVLYQIVAKHLETYLEHVREHHESGLPKYVEQDLRAYLKCGIHAHGFLRCHLHVLGLDGVYVEDEQGELRFHALGTPSSAEVRVIARRTALRLHQAF